MSYSSQFPTISFSRLALFDRSPYLYYKKYILGEVIEDDTTTLDIGSAVDCLITEPDEFHNRFAVATVPVPTAMMGDYVKSLYKNYKSLLESTPLSEEACYNSAEVTAYTEAGFKISLDKVKERFLAEGLAYFNFLKQSEGKMTISFENFTIAQTAANILKSNRFTAKYLSETLSGNKQRFYQVDSTFTYDNINYKVKLDAIVVDHDNKTIQPLDIKTTSDSPYGFTKSMWKYRYDLQAVIYSHYISTEFVKANNLESYTILPFKFIVINVKFPNNPLIWSFSESDYMAAKLGKAAGYSVKSMWEIMDDLDWHISNDLWDYTREVYENEGELTTNMYDKAKTPEE